MVSGEELLHMGGGVSKTILFTERGRVPEMKTAEDAEGAESKFSIPRTFDPGRVG